ncbi:MAG TPA: cytochrome B6 [Lacipirellulaceae bacterium]|nr:cytochrome B6 [Lacipirellulaceae bacterium]
MTRPRPMIARLYPIAFILLLGLLSTAALSQRQQPQPPADNTYMPVVPTKTFEETLQQDTAEKQQVADAQKTLFDSRYDLRNNPSNVQMSGGRKAVQQGVRVKLHGGASWESLSRMTPEQIKEQDLFPQGFRPLPHVKHPTGGMVFPKQQIDAIQKAEGRDLQRFDVDFDLPDHITPEFPPPMFLTSRPDLGDVTNGEVLTIKNYYRLLHGKVTPVQMEGMRLLLTPFPQQQFNQTEDRKVKDASLGVSCLDCHTNGHTNATFHLNPDTRPQQNRFRIETVSLRGEFAQQIHGSKRSLRSIEDFTEFEQRTAYFDGDQVTAAKKGLFLPERSAQVAMMAQMQNMFDFPPAPKLDVFGRLIPGKATEEELAGEKIFHGKGRCVECHKPPFFMDQNMQDLHLERFYKPGTVAGQFTMQDGPIKTFTLRGIKDSPPYHHDGRLLTLEDTVEFFNLVLQTKLSKDEKASLVAFLRTL